MSMYEHQTNRAVEAIRLAAGLDKEPKATDPSRLAGIGVFENPTVYKVMNTLTRVLSTNSFRLFAELNSKVKTAEEFVQKADMEQSLGILVENGFVRKTEGKEGSLDNFSPTQRGAKVIKALNSI